MKLRDIMNTNTDYDVYNDVYDDAGCAIVNPTVLTEEGEQEFGAVLDCEVEIINDCECVVLIDCYADYKHKRRVLNNLLWSAAGYCSCEDYDRWFKEV